MATWKAFASIDMKKKAGANAVPIAVGYQNNGKAYSVPDPEAFTGSRRMNYGAGQMMRGPEIDEQAKNGKTTFYGKKLYTLKDEADKYPNDESDPYYYNILVGGCNAGGGPSGLGLNAMSSLPFGVLAKGRNRQLFRNGEIEKIRAAIEKARKEGKHVRVFGHSWGGSDVANMAEDYPDIPFYALDPVSWTRVLKSLPKNLTILRPDGSMNGIDFNRGAQIFGHQWPLITKGEGRTIVIPGDHANGFGPWLTRMNREVREARLAQQKRQELLRGLAARGKPEPAKP